MTINESNLKSYQPSQKTTVESTTSERPLLSLNGLNFKEAPPKSANQAHYYTNLMKRQQSSHGISSQRFQIRKDSAQHSTGTYRSMPISFVENQNMGR